MSSTCTPLRVIGPAFQSGMGESVGVDFYTVVLVILGVLVVFAPVELDTLWFGLVGAFCYVAMKASSKQLAQTSDFFATSSKHPSAKGGSAGKGNREHDVAGRPDYRQHSQRPVSAPTFSANNFDAQVDELVCQISPSAQGDKLVKRIAASVKQGLQNLLPDAEVIGVASGDVVRGTAFAVAVPEVDIIVNASPASFEQLLQSRPARSGVAPQKLDARKMQKSVLRVCTDDLSAMPNFRFRRSAFTGLEPKVTLISDMDGQAIPFDLSVNGVTPLRNAALLAVSGEVDPRAKDLILLVRRWAKNRGVSHAAKGHLGPYAWTVLTVFFLQIWEGEGKSFLPKSIYQLASSHLHERKSQCWEEGEDAFLPARASKSNELSVATLFKEFVRLYTVNFAWRREGVSVQVGQRNPPRSSLPLHSVKLQNGVAQATPSVEDPFDPTRNLSDSMTGVALERFHEEFARAQALCSRDASLSEVIQPWAPPERDPGSPVYQSQSDD